MFSRFCSTQIFKSWKFENGVWALLGCKGGVKQGQQNQVFMFLSIEFVDTGMSCLGNNKLRLFIQVEAGVNVDSRTFILSFENLFWVIPSCLHFDCNLFLDRFPVSPKYFPTTNRVNTRLFQIGFLTVHRSLLKDSLFLFFYGMKYLKPCLFSLAFVVRIWLKSLSKSF